MSLKENMDAVKDELNSEEKFLEGMIKAESALKKYKKPLIFILSLIVLAVVAKAILGYIHQSNIEASNVALAKLEKDPQNSEALNILKSKNPKLYEAYIFSKSSKSLEISKLTELKSKMSDENLKDLLDYQIASISEKGIESYASKDGAILKDLAILEEAFKLLQEKKIKEADMKLDSISQNPALKSLVQNLKHYMGN